MITKIENQFVGTGEVKGFIFTKVFENERGYVYEVNTGESKHFEAFYKKETPICIDFEKRIYSEIDKKEVYPKSKDFGVWAWNTSTIKAGVERVSY